MCSTHRNKDNYVKYEHKELNIMIPNLKSSSIKVLFVSFSVAEMKISLTWFGSRKKKSSTATLCGDYGSCSQLNRVSFLSDLF